MVENNHAGSSGGYRGIVEDSFTVQLNPKLVCWLELCRFDWHDNAANQGSKELDMKTKQKKRHGLNKTALLAALSSVFLASCALCQGGQQTMSVIEDVQWVVSEIDASAVLPDTVVTLNFSNDGRVSGKASCNGYSGMFERDSSALKVSKLIRTKRYCHPDSLMEQEQRFSELLQQTVSWSINGQGQLVLATTSGSSIIADVQE